MNGSSSFPLITLRPAVDFRNAWIALLLESDAPLDSGMLERVLFEAGLAETLDILPCTAPADPAAIDAALGARLPPGRLVLRVPVAIAADPAWHAQLAALQEAGFGLMATGFPAADALLFPGIASLAVACPGHAMPQGFGDWLRKLPGPHLALGTTENVCPGFCKFHWLGGHLAGHAPPPPGDLTTQGLLLKLLARVMADADADELDDLIRRDPSLSYHLLKLVNSVGVGASRKIDNLAQAIAILGRRQLQRWLQLLLYVRPHGSDQASPLLPRAAMRAALAEGLARRSGLSREAQERAFLVGMFSLLDVLFGKPLAEIIAPLNLADDIVLALTGGTGPLGTLLAVVAAGETAGFPELGATLQAAGIDNPTWAAALVEATRWAAQAGREA
jgi:EAL and modified HD-GYP domain-containing signal transduction protein